jgi:hypothetical protein
LRVPRLRITTPAVSCGRSPDAGWSLRTSARQITEALPWQDPWGRHHHCRRVAAGAPIPEVSGHPPRRFRHPRPVRVAVRASQPCLGGVSHEQIDESVGV